MDYQKIVDMSAEKPVLVKIYKPDCKTCEEIEAPLNLIAEKYAKQIDVVRVNIEEAPDLATEYNIQGYPYFLVLNGKKVVGRFPGAITKIGSKDFNSVGIDRLEKSIGRYISLETLDDSVEKCESCEVAPQVTTKLDISPNGLRVLSKRYLKKDETGKYPVENPEDLFKRVAENIAQADKIYGANEMDVKKTADTFYGLISQFYFLPNSPTLMNAGRDLQQLSACFVLPVDDHTESIFESVKNTALIHKSGGGTGFSFSRVRPKNDNVKTTHGVASGPISFMYVFNKATEIMKQGGTRRGANMGILRVDHPDIIDFIKSKAMLDEKNQKLLDDISKVIPVKDIMGDDYGIIERILVESDQLNNFNISVGLTKEFMTAFERDEEYWLVNPRNNKRTEKRKAKEVLDMIIKHAWKNGEPGILFMDRLNEWNPTPDLGTIESTNPCGEQPLLPYESCNLGSINLDKMVKDGKIDYEKIGQVVRDSVHFLDNVIDMNRFPVPIIEEITKRTRKIGLGVMGFADMLIQLNVPYDSERAVQIGEEVMKLIRDKGREASAELAEKRGVFPAWEKSIYNQDSPHFKGEHLKLRNATITTIAPTGSISMIPEVSSGIEPLIALSYIKVVMDGTEIQSVNPYFEKIARESEFYSEELMKEVIQKGTVKKNKKVPKDKRMLFAIANEISPEWHIKMQAAFQKYTDNAVSKTVNFPNSATEEDIAQAYLYAHKLGCKGVTVYRDNSRETQVYHIGDGLEKIVESKEGKRPKEALAIVRRERVGVPDEGRKSMYITKSYAPDPFLNRIIEYLKKNAKIFEVFGDADFFTPETAGAFGSWFTRVSKDFRKGVVTVEEIEKEIKNRLGGISAIDEGFEAGGSYTNNTWWQAIARAITDYRPKKANNVKKAEEKKDEDSGVKFGYCESCGKNGVVNEEGCVHCLLCGESKKGCA